VTPSRRPVTSAASARNNERASRYELETEGGIAIAAYERRGEALAFTHTEVPAALQDQGIASRLIAGALADVRERGLKAIPLCAFVEAYFARHREVRDLLTVGGSA
jgi:predicted GNAT family acetyltransferase